MKTAIFPATLYSTPAASFSATLFALLLASTAQPVCAKTVRLALVAGHNRGLDSDPRLQYAEADAQKMAELLIEAGGVEEDNVLLLKSPRPEDLDRAFEDIRAKGAAAAPSDEVVFLFYFSGHGTGTHLKLGPKEYPLRSLKEHIDKIPAKLRIGILDACQSGAITRLKGARLVEPFVVENKLKTEGSILIASSAPDENAQESDQLQGSFFTHNLMSALRGAGDVSGDRRVTLMEAYQYAFHNTLVETEDSRGGAQHPMAAINLDVEGDVVLTDLNSGRGGLSFKPELDGDLLVANAQSAVMAEFRKEKGKDAFLALPPGTYRVFCKDGRKTTQFKTRLKDKEIREVGAEDLSSGFRFLGVSKGSGSPAEQAVALPWAQNDWPAQFPLQAGLAWVNSAYSLGWMAMVGYRILPHLGIYADYTFSKDWLWNPNEAVRTNENQFIRFGLESGKFLTDNIEFTGELFYRAAASVSEDFTSSTSPLCVDGDPSSCPWQTYRTGLGWQWAGGLGASIGGRIWVWNHISLQLSFGKEYIWLPRNEFNPDYLRIMPAIHF